MVSKSAFRWRRWLSIALRALHLAGVVLLALAVLSGGASSIAVLLLVLLSGVGLYAIDWWQHPGYWREAAGVFVAVKLAMVVAMSVFPGYAGALFWILLIASAVISHAPRDFRHRRIVG